MPPIHWKLYLAEEVFHSWLGIAFQLVIKLQYRKKILTYKEDILATIL